MADELTRMSAAGLAAAIAGGEVSALEVTDAHLARIGEVDQAVHAFLHVAADGELDHLAAQLDVIISAVARVQEVAAEGIPPTSHAVPLVNVFRDDVEWPCLGAEKALDQAPVVEQQRFRVPRILAED